MTDNKKPAFDLDETIEDLKKTLANLESMPEGETFSPISEEAAAETDRLADEIELDDVGIGVGDIIILGVGGEPAVEIRSIRLTDSDSGDEWEILAREIPKAEDDPAETLASMDEAIAKCEGLLESKPPSVSGQILPEGPNHALRASPDPDLPQSKLWIPGEGEIPPDLEKEIKKASPVVEESEWWSHKLDFTKEEERPERLGDSWTEQSFSEDILPVDVPLLTTDRLRIFGWYICPSSDDEKRIFLAGFWKPEENKVGLDLGPVVILILREDAEGEKLLVEFEYFRGGRGEVYPALARHFGKIVPAPKS